MSRDAVKGNLPFMKDYLSPILSEGEQDTLHPNLYNELVNNSADIIVRKLRDYSERRRSLLRSLSEKISIKRFNVDEHTACSRLVASDAGSNGTDFRSAFIPLYASAAILAEGKNVVDEPIFRVDEPQIWPDETRVQDRESLLAFKLQFEATLEAIERWKPKYVLIDGSLLLNFWLLPIVPGSTEEYKRDFEMAALRSIELLYKCFELDVPIIGFVKRTRVNDICAEMGFPKVRDTALLDLILKLGEYTEPKPISEKNVVLSKYRGICRKMGFPEENIEDILRIHFSYVKTGLTTPFRLEIPKYCLDSLKDIGSIVLATSEEDGIPFAINEVDSLVKITTSISNIRTLMIYSRALDLVKSGDLSSEDLNLLLLQYGEQWAIRDKEHLRSLARR